MPIISPSSSFDPTALLARVAVLEVEMGLVLSGGLLTTFDTTYPSASVAGSATVTIETTLGKGASTIVVAGDGAVDVTIKYAVDGGADTTIVTSDLDAVLSVAFTTQLVIKAVNANASAKNRASVSSTGVKG